MNIDTKSSPPEHDPALEKVLARTGPVTTIACLLVACMAVIVVMMSSLGFQAPGQRVRVLSSDLGFLMVCKDRDPLALDGPIEGFLSRQGFRVLNRASIQRSYGRPSGIDVDIFGLDKKRRLVEFRSFPAPTDVVRLHGRYSVSFRTSPPSQRASEIEDAVLEFVSDELQCGIRQVIRGENGPDAADLYENEVRAVENLFREADQLNGSRPR